MTTGQLTVMRSATLLYGILISPIIAFFMTASFELQRPETLMIYSIYALIGALLLLPVVISFRTVRLFQQYSRFLIGSAALPAFIFVCISLVAFLQLSDKRISFNPVLSGADRLYIPLSMFRICLLCFEFLASWSIMRINSGTIFSSKKTPH